MDIGNDGSLTSARLLINTGPVAGLSAVQGKQEERVCVCV